MNIPNYDLRTNTEFTLFEFKSNGPNGEIVKGIAYSVTKDETLYNLGFGDLVFDPIKNGYVIDDLTVSDNGDRNTVLLQLPNLLILLPKYTPIEVFFLGEVQKSEQDYIGERFHLT